MTLCELFEDTGITIEGNIKIQRWDNDIEPTIFFEGDSMEFNLDKHENIMDCEIIYLFPYTTYYDVSAICIEIDEN